MTETTRSLNAAEWRRGLDNAGNFLDLPIRSALNGSKPVAQTADRLTIGIQGAFSRDFLTRSQHQELVGALVEELVGRRMQLDFVVLEESAPPPPAAVPATGSTPAEPIANDTTEVTLNPRYTFQTFIRGSSNNLAAAAAIAVAEAPAKAYNPLFLYGGVGLGKTHLMHAIGHEVLSNRRKARVVYMSAERFTNEMIDSISEAKMKGFRRNYRNVDVLLVDDIQFLANKERTQEEFFHTFNELHSANKQIVISSDRPPRQIPTLEDRLRSRFEWGMIADVQPPDLETRIAILRKKAEQCKIALSNDVATLLAERISSNIRELEGALTRLVACASLQREPITMELALNSLTGILPNASLERVDIRRIQETVSDYFSISLKDLVGQRRDQKVVRPRQVAMYLCKELTGSSYPEIGNQFGGKDHTTVMHACRKVEANLEDHYFKTSLENIQNKLRGLSR